MGQRGALANVKKQYRYYAECQCSDCGAKVVRRKDSPWKGRCRSCACKEVASRPEIKAIQSENGRRNPPPRQNVKNYRRGPANNRWRGGITPEVMRVRNSPEMRVWRMAVFQRDSFTCQICGQRGGDLNADHIQPFALFPHLRFEVDNGRTLCVPCHRQHGACVSHGKVTRESSQGRIG